MTLDTLERLEEVVRDCLVTGPCTRKAILDLIAEQRRVVEALDAPLRAIWTPEQLFAIEVVCNAMREHVGLPRQETA